MFQNVKLFLADLETFPNQPILQFRFPTFTSPVRSSLAAPSYLSESFPYLDHLLINSQILLVGWQSWKNQDIEVGWLEREKTTKQVYFRPRQS